MTALSRLSRTALPLVLPLLLWSCGDGPDGSPVAPNALEISLGIAGPWDGEAGQTLGEAFDRADNIRIQVIIPGREPVVETLPFEPGGSEIRARVTIPVPEGATSATIIVELRVGDVVLFRAERQVSLEDPGSFSLDIELEPEPGSIELGSPWAVGTLGVPVQLDGAVLFATGEQIPGASLVWSTEATGITLTPDGVVTAHANGTYTVQAVSGELSATGQVVVTAEAAVTSISPSPVVLGEPTDIVIQGSSLQGATAVVPCGTATVAPGLTVADDGTSVEARVTWAIFSDDTGEPQQGTLCVVVSTPQGDAEGSVELVEPVAASVTLSPESTSLAVGGTVQLDVEVRDASGNLLSDDQVVFTSDRPDVASVGESGLVTAQGPGTAIVTATAGAGTASTTVTVGGGVIRGTVTSQGSPVQGVTVTLTGGGTTRTTTTDGDGEYAFGNVAPGSHTVSLSDVPPQHFFETDSRSAEIVSEETVIVDFEGTAAPGAVTGTVTVDGEPAGGLELTLNGPSMTRLERTAADGTYRFAPVPAGSYFLAVSEGQEAVFDPTRVPVSVSAGQEVVVDFAGVAGAVDLALTKSVDAPAVSVGDLVTFTIGVTNAGTAHATGVVIDDPLPAGLSFVSATPSAGSYDSEGGAWTVGRLEIGLGASLTLQATVDEGTGSSTLTNTASVAALDQTDADGTNDAASASVTVAPESADLTVTKSVDDGNPDVGGTVTFTVTVTNGGPQDATSLEVTDALPAGLSFVSASATAGSYASGTGVWTIGTLPNGSTETLTLAATVDAGQGGETLTNTASVTAVDQGDPAPGDESASADVVVTEVDLSVVKTADVTEAPEGSSFTYTVVVSNAAGFDAATNVVLSDPVPAGLTYEAHTVSQGTYTEGTGVWTVGTLAAGASATLTLDVSVDGGTAGTTITNTATVTAADQEDLDLAYPSGSVDVDAVHNPSARAYTTAGNTELVAGAYAAPATPHATDATNLLAGTPTLTAVAGTFATTNGGSVTIEADGDFSYTPAPGDAGPDSFDYTVQTGESATVTITITGMVWYVDNTAGTAGTGLSNDPFDAIADATAVTADSDGSTIYVDRGDGTSTGYLDTSLRVGQTLIGEGVDLTIPGPGTLATAGTPPVLSGGVEGSAVTLNNGVTVKGVDVVIPDAGIGLAAFGLTGGVTVDAVNISGSGNTGVRLASSTGTYTFTSLDITASPTVSAITVTGGSPTVSFGIAAGSVSTTDGRLFVVENTTGGSVTFSGGAMTQTGGDGVLIHGNAGTVDVQNLVTVTNPAGAALVITDNTASVTLSDLDITTTDQIAVSTANNTVGTVTLRGVVDATGTTAEANVQLNTSVMDVLFDTLVVNNASGVGGALEIGFLDNASVVEIGYLDAAATGDDVVNGIEHATLRITDPTSRVVGTGARAWWTGLGESGGISVLDVMLGTLSSTGGAGGGAVVSSASGSFTATGGAISNPVGDGFIVSGGSMDVTYGGSITDPSTNAISVLSNTGTVTFSGPISQSTAAARGVLLNGNGGTINITGGVDITTTTFPAFRALGGGTVNLTGTNTVESTTGSTVQITGGATIGAGGVTFESVASNGAVNGIVLDGTGSAGTFSVTGDGVTPGSGGTIQNSTGAGVSLTNVDGISLAFMDITNGLSDGIAASTAVDVTLESLQVTNNGDAVGERGMHLQTLTGTSAITNTTVTGSFDDNARITQGSGTLALDLSGSSFSTSDALNAGSGFEMIATGTAMTTVTAIGTAFDGNDGSGAEIGAENTATMTFTADASSFDGNNVDGLAGHSDNGATLTLFSKNGTTFDSGEVGLRLEDRGSVVNLDVRGSFFRGNSENGIVLTSLATSTGTGGLNGTIDGNTIESGSFGHAVDGDFRGEAVNRIAFTNNTVEVISFDGENGARFAATGATNPVFLDVFVDGNIFDLTGTSGPTGLEVSNDFGVVCLAYGTVANNSVGFDGSGSSTGVFVDNGGGTFDVEDLAGAGGDLVSLLQARTDVLGGSGTEATISGTFTDGTCSAPTVF